jgi:hypothetical protein
MQTMTKDQLYALEVHAKEREIHLQELLRAIVIPEWLKAQQNRENTKKPRKTT